MLFVFLDMPSHVTQSTIESFFRTHSGLRYVDVLREFDAFMVLGGCAPSTRYTRLSLVAMFLKVGRRMYPHLLSLFSIVHEDRKEVMSTLLTHPG